MSKTDYIKMYADFFRYFEKCLTPTTSQVIEDVDYEDVSDESIECEILSVDCIKFPEDVNSNN